MPILSPGSGFNNLYLCRYSDADDHIDLKLPERITWNKENKDVGVEWILINDALDRLVLDETATFVLGGTHLTRYEAEREIRAVATPFGEIPVTLKLLRGQGDAGCP